MMNRSLIVFALTGIAATVLSTAAFADERSDALARGAKLFADPGLGANGKGCSTCHGDGKVSAGKPRFPKVAVGGLHTLDQAIQICVTSALGAKLLAWEDGRLTALAVFVDAVYTPKK